MKTNRHNAIAKCKCGEFIYSSGGGKMSSCICGESFIDQERWSGYYVRTGGNAELIEQICPYSCEHGEFHKDNKKIEEYDELKKYLLDNYKLEI